MIAHPYRRSAFMAAAAFSFVALGPAAAPAQKPAPSSPGPEVSTWTTDNGLTVVHVDRPSLAMATVQVWYRFGSRDEKVGQRGAARMLERSMFLGSSKVRPGQHRASIEGVGGNVTSLTTEDVTAFHNAVPVEYVEYALALEADRMRGLMLREDTTAQLAEQLAAETQGQEASPLYRGYLLLLQAAFGDHPYSWAPSGVAQEIASLDVKTLQSLYDTYYQPNNALIVVVGGAEADQIKRAVDQHFGSIARASDPPHPADKAELPELKGPARKSMAGSPVGLVMIGHRLPGSSHKDMAAIQVIGALLAGGPASRLYERLVDGKVAEEIGGQVLARKQAGLMVTFARFGDDKDAAAVQKAMLAEIAALSTRVPSKVELARAVGQVLGASWFGTEGATGLSNQLGVSWALTGDADSFVGDLKAIASVTTQDIQRVAKAYLDKSNAAVVIANPGGNR